MTAKKQERNNRNFYGQVYYHGFRLLVHSSGSVRIEKTDQRTQVTIGVSGRSPHSSPTSTGANPWGIRLRCEQL